ncbi:MAG: response regulator transcription factor [Candidatus Eremiobacteraeota bacterium]|nr:response regulator transcription factor [Candidatus Eremiobacteraeota bacterium]MCW5872307.1 response regulator transcription factor [Candidatus Eremiobacteraeota bacterium]
MRVLLVDDHAVVRSGLARVLRAGGWQMVAEAGSSQEALAQADAQEWDLVVIDALLGQEDGLKLARRLRSLFPRLPLMILSMHSVRESCAKLSRWVCRLL